MLKYVHMKVKVSALKEKVATGVHKLGYTGKEGAGVSRIPTTGLR